MLKVDCLAVPLRSRGLVLSGRCSEELAERQLGRSSAAFALILYTIYTICTIYYVYIAFRVKCFQVNSPKKVGADTSSAPVQAPAVPGVSEIPQCSIQVPASLYEDRRRRGQGPEWLPSGREILLEQQDLQAQQLS